jgi:hypothetical protein
MSSNSREQLFPWSFSKRISRVFVLFLFEMFRDAIDDHDLLVPGAKPWPGGRPPRGGNSFPFILDFSSETYLLKAQKYKMCEKLLIRQLLGLSLA